jgi:hypothetical protein
VAVAVPPDGAVVVATSECPAGKQALGGSYFTDGVPGEKIRTTTSTYIMSDTTGNPGWSVAVANDGTASTTLHLTVICANVS